MSEIGEKFEAGYKLKYHLAPPLLARRDPDTCIRVPAGEKRRGQMIFQLIAGLEFFADFGQEVCFRVEPGDLVLIFIGEEFEVIPRDCRRQRFRTLDSIGFGRLYFYDEILVAPG